MAKREEDLEFISINHDDEDFKMNQTFKVIPTEGAYDSVIGSSFFKASKVNCFFF